MKPVLFFLAVLMCPQVGASDPKFPVHAIPEDLRQNVNVVFREDQMTFRIHSKSKAILSVYQAVTIMNANGKDFAYEVLGYDKLSKVIQFKGAVYDAQGEVIKKLKSSEIYDRSAFDGFSLYSDNRMKVADLSQGSYPYTVEFEYEIEYKFLFQIPGFVVVPHEKISVEHGSYTLIYPKDLKPRYNTVNIGTEPTLSEMEKGIESLNWEFKNVKPIKIEPSGPFVSEIVPQIDAAPSQFEYDGYSGTMDTWDKFGQWILSLNQGRKVLPESTKQKVTELTANLKTPEQKVKALYEYMQSKTRYVSIQLGIGGFQPFEASVVDQTGYGDCKALSNYMVSMLETAGVKANYVLIRAGESVEPMNTSFPSSQFNHAVVCVPNGRDTLWLECTSQTNPFGYMGTFTGNRKALAITDNGAAIVNTPTYTEKDNLQWRTAEVVVELTGDAKAKVTTTYSGLQYENDNLNFILSNQYDEQKKWIQENTGIPSFDINSFTMSDFKEKIPSAVVYLNLTLKRYATLSGKRMFITPNLMNRSTFIPEKVENRKTKVVRRFAYTDIDTIRYRMPEGIYPEFLPPPTQFKSRFGDYESSVQIVEGDVLYIRRIKMFRGEFPAESYGELIEFFKNVNKADGQKLVFLSKT